MSSSFALPHLIATGTHYEVGYKTGKEFETRIKTYLKNFEDHPKKILPFIETDFGIRLIGYFEKSLKKKFPWLYDELNGLSKGANIKFEEILAINMRVEILQLLKSNYKDYIDKCDNDDLLLHLLECSDFYIINENCHALLHNEDSHISIYETAYIVTYKIKTIRFVFEEEELYLQVKILQFIAIQKTQGQLPGNAFGFNSNGFTFSVNALMPKRISPFDFPRQIISRIMLSVTNLEEFEEMILNNPIAYGICINVGYFGEDPLKLKSSHFNDESNTDHFPALFNYEIAPNENKIVNINLVSKHKLVSKNANVPEKAGRFVSKNHYYHFNHYERLEVEECLVHSSRARFKRAHEMKIPQTIDDLFEMAYDTNNQAYPIYRSPQTDYSVQCVATALFDYQKKKLSIYVKSHSKKEAFLTMIMELISQ